MVIPYFYEQIELLCEDSIRIDSRQSSYKVKGTKVFLFFQIKRAVSVWVILNQLCLYSSAFWISTDLFQCFLDFNSNFCKISKCIDIEK